MPDYWTLIQITVSRDAEELASRLLFEQGTTGILTMKEADDRVTLGAYFSRESDAQSASRALEAAFANSAHDQSAFGVSMSQLADQDWMQKWKEGYEPVDIGARLTVTPSWRLSAPTEGRVVIQIDPGMAFGTGTHETTRLCLEALEHHWRGGRLLDVGTGTGILAIAAAKLEPKSHATAIDIDPVAVQVALENVALNGVADRVDVINAGPSEFLGSVYDFVIANLTSDAIEDLLPDLMGCLSPTGSMVLSGVLAATASQVEGWLSRARLVVAEKRFAGEWCALLVARYTD